MATRNYTISIVKGIGIILMVVGHAEAPWFITNFIYTFHMPLFFIAAGYFFSRKYLSDPWTFISRRVKGLYVPFVTWAVIFLLLYKLIDSRTGLRPAAAVSLICVLAVAFTAFHIRTGVRVSAVPNGFWREVWGIFFFGVGVLYRQFESRIREHWALFVLCFALLCGAAWLRLCGMNNHGMYRDLWSLPLTGCLGWLMVHYLASKINAREGRLRNLLVFIGENTLYVFILHIIAFKIVSAAKIAYYGLPHEMIGCHMVIHYNNTDFFWPIYSVVGVAAPLLALVLVAARRMRGYAARRLSVWRRTAVAD